MKNVFKRCMSLLVLFEQYSSGIDSLQIKDNILQYRELSESAFHRSFERDKDVLRQIGFEIKYKNDKWELDSGYKIEGIDIWKRIKKDKSINSLEFLTTFLYINSIFSTEKKSTVDDQNISFTNIQKAIDGKYRISFMYKDIKRIVYPYAFKLYKDIWYLCALDQNKPKTYVLDEISDLNIGKKKHTKDLNLDLLPTSFSWDHDTELITLTLTLESIRSYFIYKDVFIHKLVSISDKDDNTTIVLNTYDIYGLKIFLILNSDYLSDISTDNNKSKIIQELTHGI